MKKFLASIVAAAAVLSIAPAATAASLTPTFDVDITLNTACQMSTSPANVVFSYTAFETGPVSSTGGGFGVQCTNNLTYTLALDSTSVTDTATNLAYTLSLTAAGGTGNGAAQSYTVNGSMAGGQAGSCAASGASCTNAGGAGKTRTLTVAY